MREVTRESIHVDVQFTPVVLCSLLQILEEVQPFHCHVLGAVANDGTPQQLHEKAWAIRS